jgi:hypothetical protein
MKITETNSEQWEIRESGIAVVIIGIIMGLGGVAMLVWVVTHLASIAWWWSLVAVGVLALGALMVFTASNRQITLRRQGVNDIVTTKVIGGKSAHISFTADQIVSVNLDTSDELKTSTRNGEQTTTRERSSILYVLLRDNSEVMLAKRKSGNDGLTVNGFNMNGFSKAPLSDEAQRIAAFYGVPLSSRANNAGGIETLVGAINAVKQGITGPQQPGMIANAQPQAQPVSLNPAAPLQSVAPAVPVAMAPVQPVVPIITPMESVAPVQPIATVAASVSVTGAPSQPVALEPANSSELPPRQY